MKPYIGITGFKTIEEVHEIGKIAQSIGYPNSHTVMFGYLTSEKRVRNPAISGTRSPAAIDLASLIAATPKWAISMIHYHTKDHALMPGDVDYLVSETKVNAVQLNIDWPSLKEIEKLKAKHQSLDILLQIPERAMQGLSVNQIAKRALSYDGMVNYALVDSSGGLGKEFDIEYGAELINALIDALPKTIIGIAGGFTPQNAAEKISLINNKVKQRYFVDAESGIMTGNSISITKATQYLQQAGSILR